ncbi:MAG: rRNA (cytosine967-C5)-methyltransferase, partial [Acidimicrobiaceae bacterium]|nr:rRNA (cytosine967-C5)-methyltransferase [Acidimicrobiaceae bacterium]
RQGQEHGRGARGVAVDALVRIAEGGYANLILAPLLEQSGLSERDRGFVTELVYGTTRMRRACDWLLDRFLKRPIDSLDPPVTAALRVGAYQLCFLGTPAHAAVSATVDATPRAPRGLVNAVLRRLALAPEPVWPDIGTRLSYPDWIVERLVADLGEADAIAALDQMNQPAAATERADGYIQDEASQLVAGFVAARPGRRTADLCAAPGGKATAIASLNPDGIVVAADVRAHRTGLVQQNIRRLGAGNVAVVQADARRAPLAPGTLDRVLIDAPCSGLGVLRRRPDARWRIQPGDVDDLVQLQRELLGAAAPLLAPGATLVYSVCTLTAAETTGIDRWLAAEHPELDPVAPPGLPWRPSGGGALLLPQTSGTDGMFLVARQRRN